MTDSLATTEAFWHAVPDVERPSATSSPGLSQLPQPAPSRRTALKGTLALGGALAFSVLGAVPTAWLSKAFATVGTEWTGTGCGGYGNWGGYSDNTQVCVGAPYSSSYCGTDGWFLNYSSPSFNSWPVAACGTGGYTARNAWRWAHASRWYRCADGRQQVSGASSQFYICRQLL